MPPIVFVLLGGAVGAGFRYQIGSIALRNLGPGFPWGTLAVNLLGGLLMGILAGTLVRHLTAGHGETLRLLLGVGVLGGFTTFSAFSLETANMLIRGQPLMAAAYAVTSVAGSVLLLLVGLYVMRAVG